MFFGHQFCSLKVRFCYYEGMNNDDPVPLPCAEKLAFDTVTQAAASANVVQYRYGSSVHPYKCGFCGLWHLSSHANE
jgi:hypothetical protein